MASPEPVDIPQAKDPFERRVALTIALLGVALAVISTFGDNAKSSALLAATRASNQWAYYQAKSIKEHSYRVEAEALALATDPAAIGLRARFLGEVDRYAQEKDVIRDLAEDQEKIVEHAGAIDDRCDQAALLLQIGIVLGSVAILVHWSVLWFVSIGLGLTALAIGASALLV